MILNYFYLYILIICSILCCFVNKSVLLLSKGLNQNSLLIFMLRAGSSLYLPYQTNRVAATADIDTCQLIALPVHIYHHPLLSAVGLFIIRAKFVHLNNINYLKSMTIILTKVMVGY